MTKTKKPRPRPADHPPDMPGQAARILAGFARWLSASPGRSVTLEHTSDGWRSTLTETRPSKGATLADAAAQSASITYAETSS